MVSYSYIHLASTNLAIKPTIMQPYQYLTIPLDTPYHAIPCPFHLSTFSHSLQTQRPLKKPNGYLFHALEQRSARPKQIPTPGRPSMHYHKPHFPSIPAASQPFMLRLIQSERQPDHVLLIFLVSLFMFAYLSILSRAQSFSFSHSKWPNSRRALKIPSYPPHPAANPPASSTPQTYPPNPGPHQDQA